MDAGGRRVTRRRSVLAGISLVLACITILIATIAVWAHQVAFNTDRFTALASNALEQPEVIDPLAARISAQVVDALDVQARLTNVLPDRVTAIAGPVTLALQDGLTRRLETLLAEPRMQQALTNTLRFAHTRVMNLLRDQADAATVVDGQVVLEVYPALLVALQELQTAGIIGPEVELPDPATAEPPGVIRGILETRLGVTFPEDFGTIPLMPAERLETAQTAVRVFDLVVIALVVLAVVLVALAIWLSGKRIRMVVFLAIGTIVAFVLARLFTNAATDALTTGIAQEGLRGAIESILNATLADFRSWALLILIATGIIGVVAYAYGRPSVTRASFSTPRTMERIGIALIALVVLWIAVGLEVALLAAVLIIGLELVLGRDQGESGEETPPSASMPYTPIAPPPSGAPPSPG
jgi:hypothetical protein